MPSKKSGGKRAVEKKHREQDAARKRGGNYAKMWRDCYVQLGPAPLGASAKAHQWLADTVLLSLEEATGASRSMTFDRPASWLLREAYLFAQADGQQPEGCARQ